jgi:hypothetical protein
LVDDEVTEREEPTEMPTRSPADYDHGVSEPTKLWENNCDADKRECAGLNYYGGAGQCGKDNMFHRTFYQDEMHPGTNKITFKGKIWTIDSWDGETFTIEMVDEDGDVMATKEVSVRMGSNVDGSTTVSCPDGVDGWQDAYHEIELSAPYDA